MPSSSTDPKTVYASFDNNDLLSTLVGPQDQHILMIEKRLGVSIAIRGNQLAITGIDPEVTFAKKALGSIYALIQKGISLAESDIDTAIFQAQTAIYLPAAQVFNPGDMGITTRRRIVYPRTPRQGEYIRLMQSHELVFGFGPAGTGKTYLAVAVAVSLLLSGKIERIILSRPAVEAGEKLGFLPGDMKEKVDPYLRPLYDALHDMLPAEQVEKRLSNGEIEVAPLAFMRGRTLSNAFVILDEAQNTTASQMKMFLTRLGPQSRMVVAGDLTQIDLPSGILSGLKDAQRALTGVEGVGFITFTDEDVVRHPLVSKIVRAYEYYSQKRWTQADY